MQNKIDSLSENLNLSSYQSNKLKTHYERYNMSRLEKRGGVLYAPYATHGMRQFIEKLLLGARADLIGKNSVLLRARRGIRFYSNGYHCVRVGRYTYYADATGRIVSRQEFMDNKSN